MSGVKSATIFTFCAGKAQVTAFNQLKKEKGKRLGIAGNRTPDKWEGWAEKRVRGYVYN